MGVFDIGVTEEEDLQALSDSILSPEPVIPDGMIESGSFPELGTSIKIETPTLEIAIPGGAKHLGEQIVANEIGSQTPTNLIAVPDVNGTTVIPKVGTVNESVEEFLRTARHEGKFENADQAVAFALNLHNRRTRLYDFEGEEESRAIEAKTAIEQMPESQRQNPAAVQRLEESIVIANTTGMSGDEAFKNHEAIMKSPLGRAVKERDSVFIGILGDGIQMYADIFNSMSDGDEADWIKEVGIKMSNSAVLPQPSSEFVASDLFSGEYWATTGIRNAGSALWLMPAGIFGAWGAGSAAAAIGAGSVLTFMSSFVGGTALSTVAESLLASEQTKQDALREGFSLDEAETSAQFSFDENLKLLVFTQGVEVGSFIIPLFGKLPFGVGKVAGPAFAKWGGLMVKKATGKSARGVGRVALASATNAFEEGQQGVIAEHALGRRASIWDQQFREGIYLGAVLGAGMQSSSEIAGPLVKKLYSRSKDDPTVDAFDENGNKIGELHPPIRNDEAEKIYRVVFDEFLEQGFSKEVADAQAENALIQTDEGQAHFKAVFEWAEAVTKQDMGDVRRSVSRASSGVVLQEKEPLENDVEVADIGLDSIQQPEKPTEVVLNPTSKMSNIGNKNNPITSTYKTKADRQATWKRLDEKFAKTIAEIAESLGMTRAEVKKAFIENELSLDNPVSLEIMMSTQTFNQSVEMMTDLTTGFRSEILKGVKRLADTLSDAGYDIRLDILKAPAMEILGGINRNGLTKVTGGEAVVSLMSSEGSGSRKTAKNAGHGLTAETFAHEAIHAVTTGVMLSARQTVANNQYSNEIVAAGNDLNKLFRNIKKAHEQARKDGTMSAEELALEGTGAFDSPTELLAWGLTNETMQKHLENSTFGKESGLRLMFKNIMKALGIPVSAQNDMKTLLGLNDRIMGKDLTTQELAAGTKEILVDNKPAIILAQRQEETSSDMDEKGMPDEVIDDTVNGITEDMSDVEYQEHIAEMEQRAVEDTGDRTNKQKLMELIRKKRLGNVETLRRLLNLPPFDEMSEAVQREYVAIVGKTPDKTVFLSKRVIKIVDRLFKDLPDGSVITQGDVRKLFAEKLGMEVKDLPDIFGQAFDWVNPDQFLRDKNPVYDYIIANIHGALMQAESNHLRVEDTFRRLFRASEASRFDKTLWDFFVPTDETIYEFMTVKTAEERNLLSQRMTPEQLDLANYMTEYFSEALEYLLQVKTLEKGLSNYFVHIQKSFLENVKDKGTRFAISKIWEASKETDLFGEVDSGSFDEPNVSSFFRFALHRTGSLDPTKNIGKAFLVYSKAIEKKKAIDTTMPFIELYLNSIKQQSYGEVGRGMDRLAQRFVSDFIANKKGKKFTFGTDGLGELSLKQGGKIDAITRGLVTLTTARDLAFVVSGNIASFAGDQVGNFTVLGHKKWALGLVRRGTADGREFLKEYKNFTGRSVVEEIFEPGAEIGSRLMSLGLGGFHTSMVFANEQFLLGSATKEELESGKISVERLADLQNEMGRMRPVPALASVVGSTSLGSASMQYKRWAVAIGRRNIINGLQLMRDLKNKPTGEALTTREAQEFARFIEVNVAVYLAYLLFVDDDDGKLLKKLKRKIAEEGMSGLGALDPAMWISPPRIYSFLSDNIKGLLRIPTSYKRKDLLDKNPGVEMLKRTLAPRGVIQFNDFGSSPKKRKSSGTKGTKGL